MWGSWQVLEHELNRRRIVLEEEEARRKGLNTLIAHLKKLQKHQTRRDIDFEVEYHTTMCNSVMDVI